MRANHVDCRGAVAVDPKAAQFIRDQAIHQIHGAFGVLTGRRDNIERRLPFAPMWRAQALYAPAFLVHGDNRVAPYAFTHFIA